MRGLSKRGCHWPNGRDVRTEARLVLDRTPGPASYSYALSEITLTSEQSEEEGGQKEEGEEKKIEKSD